MNVTSTFAAESIACLEEVKIGLDHGFFNAIIEGDSLSVIKKCSINLVDRSEINAYIRSINNLISRFHSVTFQHVNRSDNSVAHKLATKCLRESSESYLLNAVPAFVQREVDNEYVREPDLKRFLDGFAFLLLTQEQEHLA